LDVSSNDTALERWRQTGTLPHGRIEDKTTKVKVTAVEEEAGLDATLHGEQAYI